MPTSPCHGTANHCSILQHIAEFCTKARTVFSHPPPAKCKIVQNYAKLPVQHHFSTIHDLQAAVLAFKPFLLSPHACGPHATPCNLWKLIQGSLTPRPCLDYLNAHLTMPWNCQSLQHIATYCSILHQSKNSFLSPSSSQVQNSAKLPLQHHLEINPRVSDPQTTPGLFECPPRLENGSANHCSILQHSVSKQEQFPLILFVLQNVPIISKP